MGLFDKLLVQWLSVGLKSDIVMLLLLFSSTRQLRAARCVQGRISFLPRFQAHASEPETIRIQAELRIVWSSISPHLFRFGSFLMVYSFSLYRRLSGPITHPRQHGLNPQIPLLLSTPT